MTAAPILIAGVGSVGSRHLRNLRALGRRDLLLYRTGRGAAPAPADLPVETSLDAALARRPRAVVVSNPTSLHLPTALAAARARAHLLIEKPVAHALDGLDELRREVERGRLAVLVGFQFRFHPTLRRVREWIAEGRIGRIVSAHAHWAEYLPDWHPGEDYRRGYSARGELGGGVILTLSHPFDYLAWMLGPVRRVGAWAGRRSGLELDVEDTALVTLEHDGGVASGVYLDYARRPPAHRLEVVGTDGAIRWDAHTGEAALARPGADPAETCEPPAGFERNAMFLDEMRHFLACVDGAEPPACTLDDGVRALRVALAARRAAEEGRFLDV